MASPEVSNLSVYHVIIFSSFSLSVTTNSPINTARLSLKSHYPVGWVVERKRSRSNRNET